MDLPRIRPLVSPLLVATRWARVGACTLLLWTAGGAAADPVSGDAHLAALPPKLRANLLSERVVLLQDEATQAETARDRPIHAWVLFESSADDVMDHLIQSQRQTEYRSELSDVEIVEEHASGHVADYTARMMLMTIEYRVQHRWDHGKRLVWWSLDPAFDNDLARLDGRWEIYPLDSGQALARFGTRIDVGPALPEFLQSFATRKRLPESMHHVRRWIDSGGTFRP